MDKPNIFTEDNDHNICKSWLCDSTDGQTYSLSDWFDTKLLRRPENVSLVDYEDAVSGVFCSQEWEDAVGHKHDYRVDSPEVDAEADAMAARLNAHVEKVNGKIRALAERALKERGAIVRYAVTFVEYGDEVDGKARVLGLYPTVDEARTAMHDAAVRLHVHLGLDHIDMDDSTASVGDRDECGCEFNIERVSIPLAPSDCEPTARV